MTSSRSSAVSVKSGFECISTEKVKWKIENFDILASSQNLVDNEKVDFGHGNTAEVLKASWQLFLKANYSSSHHSSYSYNSTRSTISKSIDVCYSIPKPTAYLEGGKPSSNIAHQAFARILDKDGNIWKSSQSQSDISVCKPTSGKTDNPTSTVIMSFDPDASPFADRNLIIEVTIKIYRNVDKKSISYNVDALNKCQENAKVHFTALLTSGEGSDVVMISRDGKKFPAHWCILCARSKLFDAMHREEWRESKDGVIKLTEISSAAVAFLLQFIYSSDISPFSWEAKEKPSEELTPKPVCKRRKLEKDEETEAPVKETELNVEEVLEIANYYEFDDLKEFVDSNMENFCNMNNAIFLHDLCCTYSLKSKDLTKTYIKNHPSLLNQIF